MDRETVQRFKTLLLGLPNWREERSRRAFVNEALWGHACLHDLDLGGRPGDVATDLLEACLTHDTPTDQGLSPLCALLAAARGKVGASPSRQADLAALEAALCGAQAAASGSSARTDQTTTVLFLAADPSDQARLRLMQEMREIEEALRLAPRREPLRLESRVAVRPKDVSRALLELSPQVVHFSGHGSAAGELYLEDETGRAKPVVPEALAALFAEFAASVRLVVLNACFAEAQARAIAPHVEAVTGTRSAIGDAAAIAFSAGLYQALAAGRGPEEAFRLGCAQVRMEGHADHDVLLLVRRDGSMAGCD